MTCLTIGLNETTTARWYHRHVESSKGTRALHVSTFVRRLSQTGIVPQERKEVLASAGISQSTYYLQFGPSAGDSLLSQHNESLQCTQHCRHRQVGDALIAEAKVLTLWPYRQGWLAELSLTSGHDRKVAAETLVRIVAMWARENQALAATLEAAAPLSAVEDLMVICGPDAEPARCASLLAQAVLAAIHPICPSPLAVLNAVHGPLMELLSGPSSTDPMVGLATALAESLAHIECRASQLSDDERSRLADELTPQLRSVLEQLRVPR